MSVISKEGQDGCVARGPGTGTVGLLLPFPRVTRGPEGGKLWVCWPVQPRTWGAPTSSPFSSLHFFVLLVPSWSQVAQSLRS